MNKSPWSTEPRTAKAKAQAAARSPLARFAGTALIVSALFGAVLYGKYETDRSSDAKRMPTSAYNDLVTMTRVCPIMRRPVRLAMADGFLTQGEAKSLRRTAETRPRHTPRPRPATPQRRRPGLRPFRCRPSAPARRRC